jgi:hypothetical protein
MSTAGVVLYRRLLRAVAAAVPNPGPRKRLCQNIRGAFDLRRSPTERGTTMKWIDEVRIEWLTDHTVQ